MLKSLLYYLITLTTAVRLADMIYLVTGKGTDLPLTVIIVTSAMIILGIFIVAKRFIGSLRYKHLMLFFIIQAGLITFNIVYIAIIYPLPLSIAETLIVGSFLDILIDVSAVYACVKYARNAYRPFVKVVGGGSALAGKEHA